MKHGFHEYVFLWDEEKNSVLLKERGIDFLSVVRAIAIGRVIDILPNTKARYEGQYIIVICINSYVWEVPVRMEGKVIKLITAYPSRKRRKEYMKKLNKDPCQD